MKKKLNINISPARKLYLAMKVFSKINKTKSPIKHQTTIHSNLNKNLKPDSFLNVPSLASPRKSSGSNFSSSPNNAYNYFPNDILNNSSLVRFEGIQIVFSSELDKNEIEIKKTIFEPKEKTYIDLLKRIIKREDQKQEYIENFNLSKEDISELKTNPYILKNINNKTFGRFLIW